MKKLLACKYAILLAVILFFAFFLRAQESISANYLFLIDQGRDMTAVKEIVFYAKPTLIGPYTSLQGVFQGPIWYYLLAVPTFLLQGDPVGGVWLMLLLSMLVVVLAYFWMGKNFGIVAGITGAFLFAFSPQAIAAATFAWNPHPMWILTLLYVITFYIATSKNAKAYLFVFSFISLMFHFETAFAVFLGIATLLYIIFIRRKDFKSKYLWFGLLISGVFFLPQILFELRHNFLMTQSVLKIFTGANQGLMVTGEEQTYSERIVSHWNSLFNNFRYAFPTIFSSLEISRVLFIMLVIGVGVQFRKKASKNSLQSFVKFLAVLTITSWCLMIFLYPFPLRAWFLTGMEVFYILIATSLIGIYWNNKVIRIGLILLALLIVWAGVLRIQYLYFVSNDTGGVHKNKGKLEAIDYIYQDAKTKDFGLLVFTPPVYTYAYDYLVWWRAKTTYGFIPPREKKDTFYLLIEPDSGNKSSYKGWLKTVVKDGKVVKTVTLPSGFIVQKRTMR